MLFGPTADFLVSFMFITLCQKQTWKEKFMVSSLLFVAAMLGAEPAFKAADTQKPPTAKAVIKDETVTLTDRGLAVSADTFPEGFDLHAHWAWTEGKVEGAYQDHLAIAVATNGTLRDAWSHEIEKGIVVRFNPGAGTVAVESYDSTDKDAVVKSEGGFIFDKGTGYNIDITYTPKQIVVNVDGKEAIKADLPKDFKKDGDLVAIYNRERVAGVLHESVLTKVSLKKK